MLSELPKFMGWINSHKPFLSLIFYLSFPPSSHFPKSTFLPSILSPLLLLHQATSNIEHYILHYAIVETKRPLFSLIYFPLFLILSSSFSSSTMPPSLLKHPIYASSSMASPKHPLSSFFTMPLPNPPSFFSSSMSLLRNPLLLFLHGAPKINPPCE